MKNITIGKPKSAELDGLDKSALHEAGHIVVANFFNCIVKSSSIDIGSGMTAIDGDVDNMSWAIIACAGPVSENVDYINDGDFSIVKESGFNEKDLPGLFSLTKDVCNKLKRKIDLVSADLLLKKKLNKKQIDKLLK